MNIDNLGRYVQNKKLLKVINRMLNHTEVYSIKSEWYEDTGYSERMLMVPKEDIDMSHYNRIDIGKAFMTGAAKRGGRVTLEEHSDAVLQGMACFMDSHWENVKALLEQVPIGERWKKDQFINGYRDILFVAAYLHDIGKALLDDGTTNMANHCFMGGEYLYAYKWEIIKCYTVEVGYVMYRVLEDVVRWHMSFILSKYDKTKVVDRREKHQKYFVTYLVSLIDWDVNTGASTARVLENLAIHQAAEDMTNVLVSRPGVLVNENGGVSIEISGFNLLLYQQRG